MFKNTISQKWVVFAFDRTDNTAVTGDAANITANVYKDGGAADALTAPPTELANGYYIFSLSQSETNGDLILIDPVSTGNTQVIGVPGSVYTVPNPVVHHGDATSGSTTSVVDASLPSAVTDAYVGHRVLITNGVGLGQRSVVTAYNGTDTLTLSPALATTVSSGTTFLLLPGGFDPANDTVATVTTNTDMRGTDSAALATALATAQTDLDTLTGSDGATLATAQGNYAPAKAGDSMALSAAAVDAVWDELLAGHVTADSAGLLLNDWQNGGRLDLLLDAIPTTAMRGTDSAATAASLTTAQTDITAILADSNELQTDDVPGLIAALNDIAALDVWHVLASSVVTASTIGLQLKTNIDAVLSNIETDTAQIGAAGAGLTALATAANLATVDTVVDAIKVTTDKFVFTVTNMVDANVQYVNDAAVTGDGNATPWDGA